jgi:hypothetical protein
MLKLLKNPVNNERYIGDLFDDFDSISLEKTNELAQMLSRIDNKYVINFKSFEQLLALLNENYAILEIKDRKQFSYSSCYYDDENYSTYFAHHQGRRNRFKVRTREYVDSKLIFFETKFKGLRGLTNKHRISSDTLVMPLIKAQYKDLIQEKHNHYFHRNTDLDLKPSLIVNYKRCTLVAKTGGERVTVDFNLEFSKPTNKSSSVKIGEDFIIVETKSADGKGFVDTCLKNMKIRQASRCSKYCLGLNLTKSVTKNNRFLATIKHIQENIVESFAHTENEVNNKYGQFQLINGAIQ